MSRNKDEVSLRQMLSYAEEATGLVKEKSIEDLETNRVLQLALIRLVEVVGEAAGRVSAEKQQQLSQIPWQEIRGMRNRLIHGYDSIDIRILLQTLTSDFPDLIIALRKICVS